MLLRDMNLLLYLFLFSFSIPRRLVTVSWIYVHNTQETQSSSNAYKFCYFFNIYKKLILEFKNCNFNNKKMYRDIHIGIDIGTWFISYFILLFLFLQVGICASLRFSFIFILLLKPSKNNTKL